MHNDVKERVLSGVSIDRTVANGSRICQLFSSERPKPRRQEAELKRPIGQKVSVGLEEFVLSG